MCRIVVFYCYTDIFLTELVYTFGKRFYEGSSIVFVECSDAVLSTGTRLVFGEVWVESGGYRCAVFFHTVEQETKSEHRVEDGFLDVV